MLTSNYIPQNTDRTQVNLEALYPREGFIVNGESYVPVFLGHPKATCLDCERPFRKHPASTEHDGLTVICGDHLMRLTEQKAP